MGEWKIMGKLLTLLVILFTIQAIFTWIGFEPQASSGGSTSSNLFNYLNIFTNPNDLRGLDMFSLISGIFTTVGVGAIIVSFFVSNNKESFLIGGLVSILLGFISDFGSIIAYLQSKATLDGIVPDPFAYIAMLIYGGLIIAYFFAAIDYWRGID
jgi:hypothetical protein